MYYMNKNKRNLILASAIINLISVTATLILSILLLTNREYLLQYADYFYFLTYSTNLVYTIISFVAGFVGSFLLIWSVRSRGKYFRISQSLYIAGFIIVVICGGWISWILLFISMFIPDIVVMNSKDDLRREDKQEIKNDRAYEEKVKRIEDLKRMRDNGLITEEEYKAKLFELL